MKPLVSGSTKGDTGIYINLRQKKKNTVRVSPWHCMDGIDSSSRNYSADRHSAESRAKFIIKFRVCP